MSARDDFTSTVDGAAAFERERALNTGDYDDPRDWQPDARDLAMDEAEWFGTGRRWR